MAVLHLRLEELRQPLMRRHARRRRRQVGVAGQPGQPVGGHRRPRQRRPRPSVWANDARVHREWARGMRRQRVHLRHAAKGVVIMDRQGTETRGQSAGAAMSGPLIQTHTQTLSLTLPLGQHLRHRVVCLGLRLLRLQLRARLPRKVCVSQAAAGGELTAA